MYALLISSTAVFTCRMIDCIVNIIIIMIFTMQLISYMVLLLPLGACLQIYLYLLSRFFEDIEEMLLRLYLIYAKSPKKYLEFSDIVSDLKEVFELPKAGDLPIQSQGSRWINHKRSALQQFVDCYGAYIRHLQALVENQSLRADD